jgi:superfamily II DNA/RNA helicase
MPSQNTSSRRARDPRRRPTHNQPAVNRPAANRSAESVTRTAPASRSADGGFMALGVPEDLVIALEEMDRPSPFPVQTLTLADSLSGADLCVKAPTGSGKTLAFAIPVALRTQRGKDGRPRALILLPTRELAGQVAETLLPLARTKGLRVATVYGGTNIGRDLTRLRQGVDVLVATPGRLADLVERRAADLSAVDVVVLDEADRMADMGFLPEVVRLLDRTSDARQTLLFSATLDGDVDTLIRRYQKDPVRHTVAAEPSAAGDVRHLFWGADRDARRRLTGDVLRAVDPAIVFTRTKHGADRLVKQLRQDGIAAAAIHGDRSQSQRERALASFRAGEVTTLVATDVAARGIHVDDVAVVVHYDLAGSDKDYQHRSGRTGRAGASGVVLTFVDPSQHADTAAIQRALALPEGLHAADVSQLSGSVTPEVTQRFAAARPRPSASQPRRPGASRRRTGGRPRSGTRRTA